MKIFRPITISRLSRRRGARLLASNSLLGGFDLCLYRLHIEARSLLHGRELDCGLGDLGDQAVCIPTYLLER
jgi:hypothetical protein